MRRQYLTYLIGFILILSVLSAVPTAANQVAVVLMYHRFGEDRYPETTIKVEQFHSPLALLKKEGCSTIPLSELLRPVPNVFA